ncbi:zinc finger protein 40-like [Varroa jacobsoni]|uniref:zinc finger protein 40-like n=1 Tax=Varroa jacobsoni TaxID=62625 RepID=UPI000BF65CA0|nr:zinc finger protein 40-like [Varroa jacobsoni]
MQDLEGVRMCGNLQGRYWLRYAVHCVLLSFAHVVCSDVFADEREPATIAPVTAATVTVSHRPHRGSSGADESTHLESRNPPPIKVIVKKANIKVTPTKMQSTTPTTTSITTGSSRLISRLSQKLHQTSSVSHGNNVHYGSKVNRDLAQRAKELAASGNYDELISSRYRKDAGKMRHQCKICGYDSFHRNAIIRHMRTHTGETPFKCGYCTYSSSQKANLMRHLKQHAGGRQVSPKDVVPVDEGDDIDEDEESEYYPTQNLVPNA